MAAIAVTVAARGADDEKPTSAELREAEVYRFVEQMIDRRDAILPRFAVVLYGEVLHDRGADTEMTPILLARARCDAKDFELIARWRPVANFNPAADPMSETGEEFVRIGDDHFAAKEIGRYIQRDEKQTLVQFKSERYGNNYDDGGHDPFDDWISIGELRYIGVHRRLESKFYGVATHIAETREGIGGQLTVRMDFNDPKRRPAPDYKEEIVFSRAQGGLPIRVTMSGYDPTSKAPPMEQRIDYKRHAKHGWLPRRFQWLDVDGAGRSEYTVMAHWLVGKDFTDSLVEEMIAGNNPDELPGEALTILQRRAEPWVSHLAPLLDHFELPRHRSVGGKVFAATYETPEGLYDD
jgi:hypothetical protein